MGFCSSIITARSRIAALLVVALPGVLFLFASGVAHAGGGCSGGDLFACLKPVVPTASCVEQNDDETFTVNWGYENQNSACCYVENPNFLILRLRDLPAASGNFFSPSPIDRGQPNGEVINPSTNTCFPDPENPSVCLRGLVTQPGIVSNLFSTTWDGSPLGWNIRTFRIQASPTPAAGYVTNTAIASGTGDDANLCPNLPPVCNLAGPQVGVIAGNVTQVRFDASASTDPENRALRYSWNISCTDDPSAVQISGVDTATPTVLLTGPAAGRPVSCSADLILRDVRNQVSCGVGVEIPVVDCAGQIGGDAQRDQCGVCNGNNSCLDCLGQPFGSAQVDRCNVCAGDGNSCLECSSSDQLGSLLDIDSNAAAQLAIVQRAGRIINRSARASRADKRYAKRLVRDADSLYVRNWRITWTLPRFAVSCLNTQFCTTQDNTSLLSEYRGNATTLKELARKLAVRIVRFDTLNAQRTRRQADRQFKRAVTDLAKVPSQQSQCTNP